MSAWRATRRLSFSFHEYLEHLVQHEIRTRESRAVECRIKAAGFPAIYRLEEHDFKRMPDLDQQFVVELHQCDWIGRGDNVVYGGKQGLGKTRLAVSNGVEACEQGYDVLFKKAAQPILELLESRNEAQVLKLRAKWGRIRQTRS